MPDEPKPILIEGDGLDSVRYELSVLPYWMDFRCLKVVATDGDGGPPCYHDADYHFTDDPAKALPYLEGSLKWDGCMNVTIHEDGVMMHFCGLDGVKHMAATLERLYRLGAEHMERFDSEMADCA